MVCGLGKRFSLTLVHLVAVLMLMSTVSAVIAEDDLSGFASIVAGRTSDGDRFLADYPKTGIYDDEWSFSPDTSIGVQLNKSINDQLNVVIQAVSHGADDYDVELDWAYINYQINPYLSLQAGRKRLPLYFYSDFFDLAHAYYWIRPPADNYTWQITNYNGLSLQYQPSFGEWDALINLYVGREDSNDNDLLSTLYAAPVDETWKNMLGVVVEFSQNWVELRGTFMRGQLDRTVNNIQTNRNVRQEFSGVSINFYPQDFIILTEFNQFKTPENDIHVDTNMISLGYQIGDFTPHLTRSSFKQKHNALGGDENHTTSSVGLRWDYDYATALKLQYDKVKDKGVMIPIMGDSESLTLGVDVVF